MGARIQKKFMSVMTMIAYFFTVAKHSLGLTQQAGHQKNPLI
jgi:hypothetical protein